MHYDPAPAQTQLFVSFRPERTPKRCTASLFDAHGPAHLFSVPKLEITMKGHCFASTDGTKTSSVNIKILGFPFTSDFVKSCNLEFAFVEMNQFYIFRSTPLYINFNDYKTWLFWAGLYNKNYIMKYECYSLTIQLHFNQNKQNLHLKNVKNPNKN